MTGRALTKVAPAANAARRLGVVATIVMLMPGLEARKRPAGRCLYLHVPTFEVILFAVMSSK
jgi:hypothetical protein